VIAEIQAKHNKGNGLVVSHKATIRVILCELLGIDLGRYRDRIDMPAGSVSIVKFDLHGPMLQVLGDRAYMGEDLRSRPGTYPASFLTASRSATCLSMTGFALSC